MADWYLGNIVASYIWDNKERTYFGSCNCETKKDKSAGHWSDDGE
jgi:hypothetical protein